MAMAHSLSSCAIAAARGRNEISSHENVRLARAVMVQVFDWKSELTLIKILVVVTAISFVVSGCTAEPQDEAPPQESPTSETVRDQVEPPATPAYAAGRNDSPASAPAETAVLAVEAEGIRFFNPVTTAATPIPFGRTRSEVLAMLERVRGPAGKGTNEDCGAGPVQYANWPDGLSLVFQRDRFAGWGLDGRAAGAISTAGSIGPGLDTRGPRWRLWKCRGSARPPLATSTARAVSSDCWTDWNATSKDHGYVGGREIASRARGFAGAGRHFAAHGLRTFGQCRGSKCNR